tara:strand:+ start:1043 stop:1402 length:360 start_codon:yes stop_codon:yes gene_type:complete
MIDVYHADGLFTEPQLVARVYTDSLGQAFKHTNHIDDDWTKSDVLQVFGDDQRHRSTSVGDLMVRHRRRPAKHHEVYLVSGSGFTCINIGHEDFKVEGKEEDRMLDGQPLGYQSGHDQG